VKGLLVSLVALALNIISSACAAHLLRPKRYLYLFAISSVVGSGVYVLLFLVTPPDLYFLPTAWSINESRLDLFYGFIIYFLNCHTFVDSFFATCGGFSVALLVAMLKNGHKLTSTNELMGKFKLQPQPQQRRMAPGLGPVDGRLVPQESDRIYAWRIPHLVARGYIRRDEIRQVYSLTTKGRFIAIVTFALKRLMNLGEGG